MPFHPPRRQDTVESDDSTYSTLEYLPQRASNNLPEIVAPLPDKLGYIREEPEYQQVSNAPAVLWIEAQGDTSGLHRSIQAQEQRGKKTDE